MTDHERMLAEGWLDRTVSARDVRTWPAWARFHLRTCEECRANRMLNGLLEVAPRRVRGGRAPGAEGLPPTVAELRARPRRVAPLLDASDLAAELEAFAPGTWRNATTASLTVTPTAEGLHVSDPEAGQVVILAVTADSRARVLHRVLDARAGVVVHLPLAVSEPLRVVVIGARGGLEPELWRLWLQERAAAGADPLVEGAPVTHVHVAELRLLPTWRPSPLRMARAAVPKAVPEVQALLTAARGHGEAGRPAEGCRAYIAAKEKAVRLYDIAGELRASIGIAAMLVNAGFEDDAERVYRDVVARFELDDALAAFVCRGLGWRALALGDLETAGSWIQELASHCSPTDALLARLRMARWMALGQPRRALEAHALGAVEGASPDLVATGAVRAALALHALGEPVAAREAVAEVRPASTWSSDARLLWLQATALLDPTCLSGSGFSSALARAREGQHDRVPTQWERAPLHALATVALGHGRPGAAREVAEVLCGGGPTPGTRRLGVACGPAETLVVEPDGALRTCGVRRATWRELIRELRTAVLGAQSPDRPGELLGDLLFNGRPPVGSALSVGHDGTLAGLPWPALFAVLGADLPPIHDVIVSPGRLEPESDRVVSLADCDGTLPGASREVGEDDADVWLRGPRATFAALADVGNVGLLHVGLHADRLGGVPTVFFADRPASALDVAGLRLRGRPIVLLSGCGTGEGEARGGIEGSLAHAFLHAGASAVVATQWPVRDHEATALFRPLVESWRDVPVESRVATVSRQLRASALPPRCWAAAVVYR